MHQKVIKSKKQHFYIMSTNDAKNKGKVKSEGSIKSHQKPYQLTGIDLGNHPTDVQKIVTARPLLLPSIVHQMCHQMELMPPQVTTSNLMRIWHFQLHLLSLL